MSDHSTDEETTALLSSEASDRADQNSANLIPRTPDNGEDEKPFPKAQVFVLCFARILEPIAFFSIFSYINKMVWETGAIREEDVGFYSGLIESLFSLTQMLFMIPWGRAADRFGRKPILVISLCGVTVASALFGFSRTIWQMIVIRCLAGMFAGTLVTLQTMAAEITTPKTQARAFSFLSISANLGILLGPFIGGVLCNPADQYPGVFGDVPFFKDFPYALPTIATGGIGVVVVIAVASTVRETLHTKVTNKTGGDPPLSTYEVFKSPGVRSVLVILANIMVMALGYTAIVPVFCFTERQLGGLGFSPIQISMVIAVSGLMQTLYIVIAFPPLQHRFGTVGILRASSLAWPIFFLMFPVCNLLLRHNLEVAFWVLGSISLVTGSAVAMAFTAIQLAVNDISPSPLTLGTLNALALVLSSGIRAVSPALFGSIFAIGVRAQILEGHLVWLVLVLLAGTLAVSVRWLPEKAYGRLAPRGNDGGMG